MKINLKIVLIFFFLFNNQIYAYSAEKIAYINLETVLHKTSYGKKVLKNLNIENEKNINNLKKFENELKTLETSIKKKQNIISQEQLDKEIEELKQMVKNYRNLKNDMVKKFEKQRNTSLNNFFSQINPIIQNYMNTNSISILLERKNVFIGKNNSDITDVIINEIDSNLK